MLVSGETDTKCGGGAGTGLSTTFITFSVNLKILPKKSIENKKESYKATTDCEHQSDKTSQNTM